MSAMEPPLQDAGDARADVEPRSRRSRREKNAALALAAAEAFTSPPTLLTPPLDHGSSASPGSAGNPLPELVPAASAAYPSPQDQGLEEAGAAGDLDNMAEMGQKHDSYSYVDDYDDDDDDYDDQAGEEMEAGEFEEDGGYGKGPQAFITMGGPGQQHAYHAQPPLIDDYLPEDTDDEPGGAQLPSILGMSQNCDEMPSHMFNHEDVEMEEPSEYDEDGDDDEEYEGDEEDDGYGDEPGDESITTPFLDMPSDLLGVYLQAGYAAATELPPAGSALPAAVASPLFDVAAHAVQVELQTAQQYPQQNSQQPPPPPYQSIQGQPGSHPANVPLLGSDMAGVNVLAPVNMSLETLIFSWERHPIIAPRRFHSRDRSPLPCLDSARAQFRASNAPSCIEYEDLEGDEWDIQGIDWEDMGMTRNQVRERRQIMYQNFVHTPNSDVWWPDLPGVDLPSTDDFFRFKRMDVRSNVYLAHFQLRNLAACPSPNQVMYTGRAVVHNFNPLTKHSTIALSSPDNPDTPISTMDAAHGVLATGNFGGEYLVRRIAHDEDDLSTRLVGTLTSSSSAITNHVQIQMPRRSSTPQACFASNDAGLRILDVATDTVVSETMFPFPINCTAMSPDGQLRVMVGDNDRVLVVPADGSRLNVVGDAFGPGGASAAAGTKIDDYYERMLPGHHDHGFACAWADDGHTIATGFQDRVVKVWDARSWKTPLATVRTQMSSARSLRFSPVGSGRRVLVAAEEADYLNIIDACTFDSKQTIDFFGEIGGIAFEPTEGRDLFAFVTDPTRGGILQLERCDQIRSLSGEMMQFRSKRLPVSSSQDGYGQDRMHSGGTGDARWQQRHYAQQQQQQQPWRHAQRAPLPHSQRRSRNPPAATCSFDWPQGSLSAANRKTLRAQARRRHREAVLDCFDGI